MAGAERSGSLNTTNNTGLIINKNAQKQAEKIKTEANFINKSLTTLGRIIRLIREHKMKGVKGQKLPVRESMLTTLLQDCFGGDALTIMLTTVTPCKTKYSQTKETQKFGADAVF